MDVNKATYPDRLPIFTFPSDEFRNNQNRYDKLFRLLVQTGLEVAVKLSDSESISLRATPYQLITGDFLSDVELARRFDIVLLESNRSNPDKGLMLGENIDQVLDQLVLSQQKREVWACILIGGQSSRMGQPKHLIRQSGRTWLEKAVEIVTPYVDGVAFSGKGELPRSLGGYVRLPDIPGVRGPLTGILSASRWQPDVSWLVLACDMPAVNSKALSWLLAQVEVGSWGSVPIIPGRKTVEPLFARYEPQAYPYFEQLAAQGERRISKITDCEKIRVVQVPEELRQAWQNINTPEELSSFIPAKEGTAD